MRQTLPCWNDSSDIFRVQVSTQPCRREDIIHLPRLLKRALELNKPVLLLNVGPTRADPLPGFEKIELASGLVMRNAVRAVL